MSIILLSLGGEAVQPQPHIPAANQSTQTGGAEGAPERTLMFGVDQDLLIILYCAKHGREKTTYRNL